MIDESSLNLLHSAVVRCVRVAARILPVDIAEDVGQDAWAGLLQALGRGKAPEGKGRVPFLIGIFHKRFADVVRKHARRRRHLAYECEVAESPLDPVDRSPGRSDMEELIEKVVRPILRGLDRADADLWLAAQIDGVGWKVAGEASGMGRQQIRQARKRISRFLGSGSIAKRLTVGLGFEPRTPNPEPRTPNPEPRTPNPEPRTPGVDECP